MVVTEAYGPGVNNPNSSNALRIGCPRNIGIFL